MTETATPKPRVMLQPRKDHFRWRAEIAEAQLAYERGLSAWQRLARWWRR